MTQEEKSLLLKDLCARLPYGVKAYAENVDLNGTISGLSLNSVFLLELHDWWDIEFIKPYLRPIHKLTKEELEELEFLTDGDYVDYCNKHHIDYRNLIPKGLALEAPKGMYNIKEK